MKYTITPDISDTNVIDLTKLNPVCSMVVTGLNDELLVLISQLLAFEEQKRYHVDRQVDF
jgi:hypothetical protein